MSESKSAALIAEGDQASVTGVEWEWVGQAYEANGFLRIQNNQLTPEKFGEWRALMSSYPRVEILRRIKAVPAGPWQEVPSGGR
ncbi:hypothetical protein ASC66_01180 [Leifsonia sp. Root4]|nr:hypothetical protein ASC66_01180 [Leifsonia sp. Root4]